jgi:hypothetical protein
MTTTRRGFLGAAAAFAGAGLLPSWRTFTQRRTIDLTMFCDDIATSRYNLTSPFAQGGDVYGSDGCILVRTKLADAPTLADGVKLPDCGSLPYWGYDVDRWRPWPKRELITDNPKFADTCPICFGRGGLAGLRKCMSCGGHGWQTIYNAQSQSDPDYLTDYEAPCKACNETGWTHTLACYYCGGKGSTKKPALQPIGSLVIAGHYDARVRTLGDAEYAMVGNAGCGDHDGWVVRFRGDGFEGLLMPMNMEARKHDD